MLLRIDALPSLTGPYLAWVRAGWCLAAALASQHWPGFACTAICIATRAGCIVLPTARLELLLAAASASAALVLVDAWAGDASDLRRGGLRAISAALACAFGAWVGA